jgi:hypothetical protein
VAYGVHSGPCTLAYACCTTGVGGALDAFDNIWVNTSGLLYFSPGTPTSTVIAGNTVDHEPMPEEGIEYTVWGANSLSATFPDDWTPARLVGIWQEGFQDACSGTEPDDQAVAAWSFGDQTFAHVAVYGSYSMVIDYGDGSSFASEDIELDAVATPSCTLAGTTTAATATPEALVLGQSTLLEGATSATVLTWSWELDESGSIDETGSSLRWTPTTAGDHEARLYVLGADGCVSTDTVAVHVCDPSEADNDEDGAIDEACGGDDCDDEDGAVGPSALELCGGADEDCDGLLDDADPDLDLGSASTWYTDADGDGHGDSALSSLSCLAPPDGVATAGDCDDGDADFHPGAPEEDCADPSDYNCDGSVAYEDLDEDGFPACTECDDADGAIHPAAEEVCDGVDNNCNGEIDEAGSGGETTWYTDADGDGYGDSALVLSESCLPPEGSSALGGDCDDSDTSFHPGAAEEDCADPSDYNCDGSTGYADLDGDGWAACSECDDGAAGVNPDSAEVCNDLDDDCDGLVDDADDSVDLSTGTTSYTDGDGDSYGDPGTALQACEPPEGAVLNGEDCDDNDDDIYPGAPGLGEDCLPLASDSGGEAEAPAGDEQEIYKGGCSCQSAGLTGPGLGLLLSAGALLRRRRR